MTIIEMPKGSSTKFRPKGKGKEQSDKKGSLSKDKAKPVFSLDPYAASLSNRVGLERYVHEPAYESAWNPVGAVFGGN
ncbi:hypothetical protein VTI28DRAFT_7071 [Corynascus sepedonium]